LRSGVPSFLRNVECMPSQTTVKFAVATCSWSSLVLYRTPVTAWPSCHSFPCSAEQTICIECMAVKLVAAINHYWSCTGRMRQLVRLAKSSLALQNKPYTFSAWLSIWLQQSTIIGLVQDACDSLSVLPLLSLLCKTHHTGLVC